MDLSKSFNPIPKPKKINKKAYKKSDEISIMPKSELYCTERKIGLDRHEVFFGSGKRQLSIDYGLFIFLTPEMHNMDFKEGIHFNELFRLKVQKIAQITFEELYGHEKFMQLFGQNYIEKFNNYIKNKNAI